MAHIRTIEDGYQYRIHRILNKLKADINGTDLKEYLNTKNGKLDLAEAVLEDIEQYCGLADAIETDR